MTNDFDVAIVGSGPAGIACALSIKRRAPTARVVLLERGRQLHRRPCPVDRGHRCTGCGGVCNVISGFGGSIHYGDGVKLSLLPSGRRLIDLFGDSSSDLCERAYGLFVPDGDLTSFDGGGSTRNSERVSREILLTYGIVPREYPVKVIGETQLRGLLLRLEQDVELAAEICYRATFSHIEESGARYSITYISGEKSSTSEKTSLTARNVVLATGRAGISTTQRSLSKLGIGMTPPSYSKGIRVEMPHRFLHYIGSEYPDLKISSHGTNQKTKTFCFCGGSNGGRIKFTHYQQEFEPQIITLDGHETLERRPAFGKELAANFGLLCQQEPIDSGAADSHKFRTDFVDPYQRLSGGHPVVQLLADFRARRVPNQGWADLVQRLPFQPSVLDLKTAPIHQLFTLTEHRSMLQTFDSVMRPIMQIEGIELSSAHLDNSVIVIAPEVEFLWNKVEIDNNCETRIRGVYVVGDAAGIAQGVIQAAMMGVKAGDHIASKIAD